MNKTRDRESVRRFKTITLIYPATLAAEIRYACRTEAKDVALLRDDACDLLLLLCCTELGRSPLRRAKARKSPSKLLDAVPNLNPLRGPTMEGACSIKSPANAIVMVRRRYGGAGGRTSRGFTSCRWQGTVVKHG